jgi:branched-chain amino acid aminotransferase
VAECTSANIFAAVGNRVFTPPLSSGCLPGITREVLLGEIRVPGIDIQEKVLGPADLEAADEVFITSTTRNLLPVELIEKKRVGRSDHVREKLEQAFEEYIGRYVAQNRAPVPAQG